MNSEFNLRESIPTVSLYVATAALPFSIVVCHAALVVFIAVWLFEGNWKEKVTRLINNAWLTLFVVLLLIFLASAYTSNNQNMAWFAVEKKIFFFAMPFAIATAKLSISATLVKRICIIFCISTFIAVIICFSHALYQIVLFNKGMIGNSNINYLTDSQFYNSADNSTWLFLSYTGLSGGLGLHPTYLSMYAAFSTMFLILDARGESDRKTTILYYSAITFYSVAIIFLSSRVVLLAVVLFYLCLLIHDVVCHRFWISKAFTSLSLIVIMLSGIMINPIARYRQVEEIAGHSIHVKPNNNYTNSTSIRLSLWWLSVQAFLNSDRLVGTGVGDVEAAVGRVAHQQNISNVLGSNNPHSEYLFMLIATGVIGFLSFISYLLIAFLKAWRTRDAIFLSFLFLFAMVAITESVLELQKGIVFFTIFFSIFMVHNKNSMQPHSSIAIASAGK